MYTRPVILYSFDLVGVFAFAFLGSRSALERRFNVWGVVVCGFLASLGGGTIRSVILNKTPFYFHNPLYFFVVFAGAGAAAFTYGRYKALHHFVPFLDGVGMIAFAYIGAHAAVAAHLGESATIFFALLTACGGGVLCDLVTGRLPGTFQATPWYAAPPVILGAAYGGLGAFVRESYGLTLLVAGTFLLQVLVAYISKDETQKLVRRLQHKVAGQMPGPLLGWLSYLYARDSQP